MEACASTFQQVSSFISLVASYYRAPGCAHDTQSASRPCSWATQSFSLSHFKTPHSFMWVYILEYHTHPLLPTSSTFHVWQQLRCHDHKAFPHTSMWSSCFLHVPCRLCTHTLPIFIFSYVCLSARWGESSLGTGYVPYFSLHPWCPEVSRTAGCHSDN